MRRRFALLALSEHRESPEPREVLWPAGQAISRLLGGFGCTVHADSSSEAHTAVRFCSSVHRCDSVLRQGSPAAKPLSPHPKGRTPLLGEGLQFAGHGVRSARPSSVAFYSVKPAAMYDGSSFLQRFIASIQWDVSGPGCRALGVGWLLLSERMGRCMFRLFTKKESLSTHNAQPFFLVLYARTHVRTCARSIHYCRLVGQSTVL